jgi:hypothetical protein
MVKKINQFLRIICYDDSINIKRGNLKMRTYTETDLQNIKNFCQEKNINQDYFAYGFEVKYFDTIQDLKSYYIELYYEGLYLSDPDYPHYLDIMSFKGICNLFLANYHHNYVLLLDDNRALICVYGDQVFFDKGVVQ